MLFGCVRIRRRVEGRCGRFGGREWEIELTPGIVRSVIPLRAQIAEFGIKFLASRRIDGRAILPDVARRQAIEADGPGLPLLAALGEVLRLPALHVIAHFERGPAFGVDARLGVVAFDGRALAGLERGGEG